LYQAKILKIEKIQILSYCNFCILSCPNFTSVNMVKVKITNLAHKYMKMMFLQEISEF
jgi:hypothetical protein